LVGTQPDANAKVIEASNHLTTDQKVRGSSPFGRARSNGL
jgi:hypothetical protein